MAWSLSSGNAIGVDIRSEQEGVAWLEELLETEPEALDHVGVIEFDRKGHALRVIVMNREGLLTHS